MQQTKQFTSKQTRTITVLNTRIALLGVIGISVSLPGHSAESVADALATGKMSGDIRYRYEYVDLDGTSKKAGASTVRTALNYTSEPYYGVGGVLEFEDVSVLGGERYNSTVNGMTKYPVVADPAGTEVNQAYLSYTGLAKTTIKWGRQRIILDNQRFVGNVGWRQNEQTFDALSFVNTTLPNTTLTYAYVGNVNTVFGNDSVSGDIDTKAHLLNAAYGFAPGKLTGYGYFLEYENIPKKSNQTLGVRFTGATKMNENVKLLYAAEYAKQSDYQDGASTIDADYLLGEIGTTWMGVTAKIGYEVLGGDGVYGFDTPLATKHAFNGWADQFLATPTTGLKDVYLAVGGKVADVDLLGVYHDYSSDKGSMDYGTEWNFLASKSFGKNYSVLAKYAAYSADTFKKDVDKIWLSAQVKF